MIFIGLTVVVVILMVVRRLGRTARATERMAAKLAPRSQVYKIFNAFVGLCIVLLILFVAYG